MSMADAMNNKLLAKRSDRSQESFNLGNIFFGNIAVPVKLIAGKLSGFNNKLFILVAKSFGNISCKGDFCKSSARSPALRAFSIRLLFSALAKCPVRRYT